MPHKSYYEVLQLEKSATPDQIKTAFRRLAMYYHPDKVKHLGEAAQKAADQQMRALGEAFEVLRNPEKRKLYDHCLAKGLDYTMEYSRAQSEKPEDKVARAQQDETRKYMFQAVLRIVKENVQRLVEDSKWQAEDDEKNRACVLRGLGGGDRMTVKLRLFEEFGLAELDTVFKELDAMKSEGAASNLLRDHFSWLVVSQRFKDDIAVREAVKKYNFKIAEAKRGEPRRGICFVKIDKKAQPFCPHGDLLRPPFVKLEMKLI